MLEISLDTTEMALNIEMNEERFVALLTKLIGEAKHVQNSPPELVPQVCLTAAA